ncbi:MAG TPA: NAD(P)-dependent oxidoreductase [Pseudogracilibacillus sp.]|nr:NAD(P)-dependent oxidoreductase [Pseudogracilibacillus sp.]
MNKKPLVYITRKLPQKTINILEDVAEVEMWDKEDVNIPRELLLSKSKNASALITMLTEKIDGTLLSQAKNMKVISNLAVGYDNVDVTEASKYNIKVTNTPDVLTETTADLAFTLLMSTARRVIESVDYIRNNQWTTWSPMQLAGKDIHNKTIGIFGMGRIGEAISQRAKGFGMEVIYNSRTKKEEAEKNIMQNM